MPNKVETREDNTKLEVKLIIKRESRETVRQTDGWTEKVTQTDRQTFFCLPSRCIAFG